MKAVQSNPENMARLLLRDRVLRVFKHLILAAWCLTALFPITWVAVNAFRDNNQIYGKPFALPDPVILRNFPRAFFGVHLNITLVNSMVYSAVTVVTVVLLSLMTAFYLTKMTRGSLIYTYFIAGIMIPAQAILIPIFLMMRDFSLINTRAGIIIIYITTSLSFGIFILSGFMKKGVPDEILEAAVIDGCGPLRCFFNIALPMSQTGIVTVATFIFLNIWNEFLFALIMLPAPDLRTLNLSVYMLRGPYSSDQGLMASGIAILIAPAIIIYILFQDQVVEGLTAGALKG